VGRRRPADGEQLRTRLGARFGGAWLSDGGDQLVVAVTRADQARSVRAAGAKPILVRHSEAELSSMMDRLDATAREPGTVSAWSADPRSNRIVVKAMDQAAAARWVKAAGVDEAAVRIVAATDPVRRSIDGGLPYQTNRKPGRCSVGFGARRGTQLGFITAGHCGSVGDDTAFGVFGTFRTSVFPGTDSAFVSVDDPNEATPFVFDYQDNRIGITGTRQLSLIGEFVCHFGIATRGACGQVTAFVVSADTVDEAGNVLGTVRGLTETSACSKPGDSGGPWIDGTLAVGIHSAGFGFCGPGQAAYFVPINQTLSDLPGVEVLTVQPARFRISSFFCQEIFTDPAKIECEVRWTGGTDPAAARWTPTPTISEVESPTNRISVIETQCGHIRFHTEPGPNGPNYWAHDPLTINVTVTDFAGRTDSASATVTCTLIGW
jgi:streptogrisin C